MTRRGRIIPKNEGSMIGVANSKAISFMDDGDDDNVFCTNNFCVGDGEAMVLYQGECIGETTTLTFMVAYEEVDFKMMRSVSSVPRWKTLLRSPAAA